MLTHRHFFQQWAQLSCNFRYKKVNRNKITTTIFQIFDEWTAKLEPLKQHLCSILWPFKKSILAANTYKRGQALMAETAGTDSTHKRLNFPPFLSPKHCMAIEELLTTERVYLKDLHDIFNGYFKKIPDKVSSNVSRSVVVDLHRSTHKGSLTDPGTLLARKGSHFR